MGSDETTGSAASADPVSPSDDVAKVGRRPLGYQPALDGWRGIGILMVMAYHAGLRTVVPGAFLWIDGFFTVSAFLIATLLLEEHNGRTGRISLRGFWGRRIRRLGPALILTLVAMAAFGLVADKVQRAALPADVLATLFYVANWRSIAAGSDYFAAFTNDSPLKHTWSLAIEEQFYVIFPLLLVGVLTLAKRLKRSGVTLLGVVAVGGTLASAAWMAWLHSTGATTSRLYYGTDTRAQSLLAGVSLAAWWQRPRRAVDAATAARRRQLVVGAGAVIFVAVAVAQFFVHEDTPMLYSGGFFAAAVGQAVVFRAALEPSWFQRALAWKPLVWVGGMAYGLYLFHFPLFLFLSPERVGTDGPALFALRFAATFALAVPVLKFIEQPIRSRRWPKPGTIAARTAWPVAVAVIAAGGLLITPPAPEPSKQDLRALVVTTTTRPPVTTAPTATGTTADPATVPGTAGTGTVPVASTALPTTTSPPKAPPRIAVVGDSTGTRLAPGVEAWATATGAAVWVGDAARVGCPIGRGGEMHTAADASGPVNASCDWSTSTAPGFDGVTRPTYPGLVAAWRPDLVVASFGPWDVADRKIPGDPTWRYPGDPVYDRWLLGQMTSAVDSLTASGAHVVWLTQPPWEGATRHPPERLYAPAGDPARMARFNEVVRQAADARAGKVTVLDYAAWIASTGDDARLRPDGAHLEPETAVEVMNRYLGTELLDIWERL